MSYLLENRGAGQRWAKGRHVFSRSDRDLKQSSMWARREEIHVPCPGPGAAPLPTADLASPPLALEAVASVAEFLGMGWMARNHPHACLHHWRPDVSLAR